jgi:hypothetical protein
MNTELLQKLKALVEEAHKQGVKLQQIDITWREFISGKAEVGLIEFRAKSENL